MLNTAIGLIVFFVAGVAVLIFREKVFDSIITMSYLKNHIGAYVLLISLFFCAINVISAPSISLEGENLWICKAMPVEPFDILMAKVKNHIYICMRLYFVKSDLISCVLSYSHTFVHYKTYSGKIKLL